MEQNKSIHKSPAIDPVRDLCNDEEYQKYVAQKLAEAEEYAARPDAVWHKFDDVALDMGFSLADTAKATGLSESELEN